jgi:hypothetical protein
MWERVERARADSDVAFFNDLLLLGEVLLKLTVSTFIAAINDETNRYRYRHCHRLVRADGFGEWNSVLDDVLTGPSANYMVQEANVIARSLTQKLGHETWQHQCATLLNRCLQQLASIKRDAVPAKVPGKRWFADLVELRNKTRGHGAVSVGVASALASLLEQALRLYCDNCPFLPRPWAFLHQNLSGKYRVSRISADSAPFESLKNIAGPHLPDGVYIYLDQPRRVELLHSDPDQLDFYFPNGAFDGTRYELLSYITGNTTYADAAPYSAPAQPLPESATQGRAYLDIQGNTFSNAPPCSMNTSTALPWNRR